MAVKFVPKQWIQDPDELIGLSTDTKPTTDLHGNLLRPGSSFYTLDTKVIYLFDGISAWYEM